MNAEENIKREFGGKQYTKYEALQRQRRLETTMRAQRQQISLLTEGGADEDDIITARGRYRVTSAEYARFSNAMDLPQQRERVTVDGLGNVGVGKWKKPVDKSGGSGIIKERENSAHIISMQFFANKNIPKMKSYQLSKSIKSWNEQIEIHKKKIASPELFYEHWDKLDERYKNGLIKHWEHEIKVFSNDIQEATDELNKRGE